MGLSPGSYEAPLKDNSESQLIKSAGKHSGSIFRAGGMEEEGLQNETRREGSGRANLLFLSSPPVPPHNSGLWVQINYFNNPILNVRPKSVAPILI